MNPIVVLGMHRSGTSALTGVFNRLGFSAGKHLLPANRFNVRGYFEDTHLNQRLDNLLNALGRSWCDERLLPFNWMLSDAAAETAETLKVLLAEEFDINQPSVIKDPRVCRLLPLLQSVWQSIGVSAMFVFSLRTPFAVIQSLRQRDSLPAQRAALLYVAYLFEAELHTRNYQRVFIKYDDLIRDWRQTIDQIGSGLCLNSLSVAASEVANASSIDAFLSTNLNHFTDDDVAPTGAAVDLAVELFSLLQNPLDTAGLSALNDLREKWLDYLDSLEPWLSEASSLNLFRKELPTALFKPSPEIIQEACLNAKSDIFWPTISQDYSEELKISCEWRYGEKITQKYIMRNKSENLTSLRWDITDRPAFCLINKVWIEDSKNNIVWAWKPGDKLFGLMSSDMHDLDLNENRQLQIISSGFDPHAPLLIPDEILTMIKDGWSLCTEWHASMPTLELGNLMNSFSTIRNHLNNTKENLVSTQFERDTLLEQTKQQDQHLALLNQQQEKTQEEIIKAEAQLTLLKDLWREGDLDEKL